MKVIRSISAAALVGSLFLGACATLPDDAPLALHEAQAELDKATELETAEIFPKSIEQSEAELDSAIASYNAVPEEDRSSTVWSSHPSVTSAESVRERLSTANSIRMEMTALDGQLDTLDGNASISTLSAQVAMLKQEMADMQLDLTQARAEAEAAEIAGAASGSERFALLSEMTLKGPTLFFGTGEYDLAEHDKPALKELANSLQEIPQVQLRVIGYADPRGSDALNESLSSQRAESVRNYLLEQGVAADQIVVQAMGEKAAFFNEGQPKEKLQLERRVEMIVSPLAR